MEKGKRKDDQRQLAEEIIIVVDSRVRIIPTYIAGAAHESYIVLLDDGEFVYDGLGRCHASIPTHLDQVLTNIRYSYETVDTYHS
jgi:hypothetical protein